MAFPVMRSACRSILHSPDRTVLAVFETYGSRAVHPPSTNAVANNTSQRTTRPPALAILGSLNRRDKTLEKWNAVAAHGMRERLQLRPVTRFDRGLGLGFSEPGLLVDDLADARQRRALHFGVGRPQFCAHQCLAAVEIRLAHGDA